MTVRRRVAVAVLAAAAAATAVAAPAAVAGPETAPTMTAAGGTQRGRVTTYRRSARQGDLCSVLIADGVRTTDESVPHDGSGLTWRIPDRRRPTVRLTLTSDLPVQAAGRSRRLPADVAPVTSQGRVVAWTVTTPDVGYGDLHLSLDVHWPGACGGDRASYRYRARSLPVLVP